MPSITTENIGDNVVTSAKLARSLDIPTAAITALTATAATVTTLTLGATALTASAGAPPVVTSVSGGAPQELSGVVNSTPKSVITPMAGFAGGGPAATPVAVTGRRSATADGCPHNPGCLTATPASLK